MELSLDFKNKLITVKGDFPMLDLLERLSKLCVSGAIDKTWNVTSENSVTHKYPWYDFDTYERDPLQYPTHEYKITCTNCTNSICSGNCISSNLN
jgi:hypothetical protein